MASPLDRNRLADEPSPYLVQHADNPVHWQPWEEPTLAAAKDRDRPIFCSIGYAACHWCHVMEEESFEHPEIAERLNASFVPIKVDREERPDLDRVYQTICQLVTGSGGWPLSVFLTPDGRPFYVGTYFPPEPKRGRPGFDQVLDRIAESWESDREEIEERADQWEEAIRQEHDVASPAEASTDDHPELETVARSALRALDQEHGGFGDGGPKFPQPGRVSLLLRADQRLGGPDFRNAATLTLDAMADRGLFDQLGGGFHRYATDRAWRVPHFEKMLYDNAELARLFTHAHQITGRERYAEVVERTLSFVTDELRHPEGGCYSTLDAQSEGQEGAYYVWSQDDVHAAIEEPWIAEIACEHFGITSSGNFEGGTSVLSLDRTAEEIAADRDRSTEDIRDGIATARDHLLAARDARERPARDEKILAGWNGLMAGAFAEAGLVLDERWVESATDTLAFVREHLWDADAGRLARRYKDGTVGIDGYLDDYAYTARGALRCYEASGDVTWLDFAVDLADAMVDAFWDAEAGALQYTPADGEALVSRPIDAVDQSTPSSLAVGLEVLATLDAVVPDRGFEAIVEGGLATHAAEMSSAPLQHVSLVALADRMRSGDLEWTIVADALPAAWRSTIAATYAPDRLVARRPPSDEELASWMDRLGVEDVPPIWADRTQRDGQPTAYVCRDFTCSPPLTDPDEAVDWLDRLGVTR